MRAGENFFLCKFSTIPLTTFARFARSLRSWNDNSIFMAENLSEIVCIVRNEVAYIPKIGPQFERAAPTTTCWTRTTTTSPSCTRATRSRSWSQVKPIFSTLDFVFHCFIHLKMFLWPMPFSNLASICIKSFVHKNIAAIISLTTVRPCGIRTRVFCSWGGCNVHSTRANLF
jgi:hypothetical protein